MCFQTTAFHEHYREANIAHTATVTEGNKSEIICAFGFVLVNGSLEHIEDNYGHFEHHLME